VTPSLQAAEPTKSQEAFKQCIDRLQHAWRETPARHAAHRLQSLRRLLEIWESGGHAIIDNALGLTVLASGFSPFT
jgi:hypothetical protein